MHCPIYNFTARSALCLEYQARARGESLPKKSSYNHPSEKSTLWAIKYKSCLTCETGRQVKENGGSDSDVENLIAMKNEAAARQLKRCPTCKLEKPLDAFARNRTNKDGLQNCCRECQAAIQKKSYQKLKGIKVHQATIPEPTVNVMPNVTSVTADVTFRKCQICKGTIPDANDFHHEPNICDMCWESDQHMNTPIPPPPVERTPESTPTHAERTCRNCGHQGPDTDFYKTGSQGYTNVCKACAQKKRAETISRQAAAGVTPIVKLPESCVVLNFSEYPELLKTIRQAAKINFRTIDNEILFRIVNHERLG